MKSIRLSFFLLLFLAAHLVSAQSRNNIWCFGDSAGIDFNNISNPTPISTALRTRGTCVSVSDSVGNLLFYGNTRAGAGGGYVSGVIWNRSNNEMLNGDSIAGGGWYNEMVIIPNPIDDSLYYLFSIGVTQSFGLMYSIIDLRGDNTFGEVTQKNVQLLNYKLIDQVLAIKHGNGRDWWIIVRRSGAPGTTQSNNEWIIYLISQNGVSALPIQNVGSLNRTNLGRCAFDPVSNKICFINTLKVVEMYDFDRCTGTISNPVNIEQESILVPNAYYWSCEFSATGRYLYLASPDNPGSKLWQYDTWDPNIFSTKTLIWQTTQPIFTLGALKRGPDNKIYVSCAWVDSIGSNNYPYDSTEYYSENMNLGVINSPDSAGLACDFQPWSFYLGGKRTYWGLPNNPDYDLGPLIGSGCDTLTSLPTTTYHSPPTALQVTWSSSWQKAFINASNLKGQKWRLEVYDLFGNRVYIDHGTLTPPYFSRGIELPGIASGMYVVRLETEREALTGKFIVHH